MRNCLVINSVISADARARVRNAKRKMALRSKNTEVKAKAVFSQRSDLRAGESEPRGIYYSRSLFSRTWEERKRREEISFEEISTDGGKGNP